MRGASTTEYLFVLAAVFVVAVVAAAVLGFFPVLGADIHKTQTDTYWKSSRPISIVESKVGQGGMQIVLQNYEAEAITVTEVVINQGGQYYSYPIVGYPNGVKIEPGEKKTVTIDLDSGTPVNMAAYRGVLLTVLLQASGGVPACVPGETVTYRIIIVYRTAGGTIGTVGGRSGTDLTMTCSEEQICAQCGGHGCCLPLVCANNECLYPGTGNCNNNGVCDSGETCEGCPNDNCCAASCAGRQCSIDSECCNGFACANGVCAKCGGGGEKCSWDSDCCQSPDGQICAYSNEASDFICQQCKAAGSACTGTGRECCGALSCFEGKCTTVQPGCLQNGAQCAGDSDCCQSPYPQTCTQTDDGKFCTLSCGLLGDECGNGLKCCDPLACVYTAIPEKATRCYPTFFACRNVLEKCNADTDCCQSPSKLSCVNNACAPACAKKAESCERQSDCCTGLSCTDKMLAILPMPLGAALNSSLNATNSTNATCQNVTCALPLKGCRGDFDCCIGKCEKGGFCEPPRLPDLVPSLGFFVQMPQNGANNSSNSSNLSSITAVEKPAIYGKNATNGTINDTYCSGVQEIANSALGVFNGTNGTIPGGFPYPIVLRITNAGSAKAGPTVARLVWISRDCSGGKCDKSEQYFPVGELKAGEHADFESPFSCNDAALAGLEVDYNFALDESDKGNNYVQLPIPCPVCSAASQYCFGEKQQACCDNLACQYACAPKSGCFLLDGSEYAGSMGRPKANGILGGPRVFNRDPSHNVSVLAGHPRLLITADMIGPMSARLNASLPGSITRNDFNFLKGEFEAQTDGVRTSTCNLSSTNMAAWVGEAMVLNNSNGQWLLDSSAQSCGHHYQYAAGNVFSVMQTGVFLYWMTGNETYLNRSKYLFGKFTRALECYNATSCSGVPWMHPTTDPYALKDFYDAWGIGGGISYDWLYSYLSNEERVNFTRAFGRFVTDSYWNGSSIAGPMYTISRTTATAFGTHEAVIVGSAPIAMLSIAYDSELDAALNQTLLNELDYSDRQLKEYYHIESFRGSDNGGYHWSTYYTSNFPAQTAAAIAMTTATDNDEFAQNPWITQKIADYYAYQFRPDLTSSEWGDGQMHLYPPFPLYTASAYGTPPYNEYANWFIANHQAYYEKAYRWDNTMWQLALFDESAPRLDSSALSLDWASKNQGLLVSRSEWGNLSMPTPALNPYTVTGTQIYNEISGLRTSRTPVYLTFNDNTVNRLPHNHLDANSFSLYYKGDLVLDSGTYDAGYATSHYNNYYARTVSHNTITVYDPSEVFTDGEGHVMNVANDGGQIFFSRTWTYDDLTNNPAHKMGNLTHYEAQGNYTYFEGDASRAYNSSKLSNFTREVVFLKPKTIVIFDRVNATNASFRKSFLLHFAYEPGISGGAITQNVSGHIVSYSNGTMVREDADGGRVYAYTLLPQQANITKIGGAGYEYWVDGTNYNLGVPATPNEPWMRYGGWRTEVSPTVPSNFDNFLHVLFVSDAWVPAATSNEGIYSADGTVKAARANDDIVSFSTYGNALLAISLAPFTHTGATRFLFVDLKPLTPYNVSVQSCGAPENSVLTSSAEGTIFFTKTLCGPTNVALNTGPIASGSSATRNFELLNGGKIAGGNGDRSLALGRPDYGQYGDLGNYSINFSLGGTGFADISVQAFETPQCYAPSGNVDASINPWMGVNVDGISYPNMSIANTSYQAYNVPNVPLSSGNHTLTLSWLPIGCTAGGYGPGGGHRVIVRNVTLSGPFNMTPQASVNLGTDVKQIGLHYGFNGKDEVYWESAAIQQHYRDTHTDQIRIWVHRSGRAFWPSSNPAYYSWHNTTDPADPYHWASMDYSNEPYNWSGSGQYNYTNLDRDVKTVLLNISATPYINFPYFPSELMVRRDGSCGQPYYVPRDQAELSNYLANVVDHYHQLCTNGTWDFCGNFSRWYWSLGNEMDGKEGCTNMPNPWAQFNSTAPESYISFFNTAYATIKARVPDATVGGWEAAGMMIDSTQVPYFLNRTPSDLIVIHPYDTNTHYSLKKMQDWIDSQALVARGGTVPIIAGEYNYEFTETDPAGGGAAYIPQFDPNKGDFGAMWEASALNWLARSSVVADAHFEGNSYPYDSAHRAYCYDGGASHDGHVGYVYCYGMWSGTDYDNYSVTPMFYARKRFTTANPTGATIAGTSSSDDLLEVFAVNAPHKAITLINKRNETVTANVSVSGNTVSCYSKLTDDGWQAVPMPTNDRLVATLLPYEAAVFYANGCTCIESWVCTGWNETCRNGSRGRTCVDENSCGTTAERPALSMPCGGSSAGGNGYNLAPGHNVSVLAAHPRIYLTTAKVDEIKAKLNAGTPILTGDFNMLKSQYELQTNGVATWACSMAGTNQSRWTAVILNTSNMYQKSFCGNGSPNWQYGGSWQSLIQTGAFLYMVTGNQTYLNRSKFMFNKLTILLQTYNSSGPGGWNPVENMTGWDPAYGYEGVYESWSSGAAVAYDWLYNDLTPQERTNFTNAFADFVTNHYYGDSRITSAPPPNGAPDYVMGHSFKIQQDYGMGLLALAYDPYLNSSLNQTVLDQLDVWHQRMKEFYHVFNYTGSDNGGWNWGTGYDFSGMSDDADMAAALTTSTDTNWFAQNPWIPMQVMNHYAYLLKPNGYEANWGDYDVYGTNGVPTQNPVLLSLISNYGANGTQPYNEYANNFIATKQAQFEKQYRWYNGLWEIAWFNETAARRNFSILPLDWFSKNAGQLVSRTSWSNTSVWLTFANNPKERSGHLHMDANSFSLYGLGYDAVVDSGTYNPGGGYASAHWANYYQRAIAHNTVTVYDPSEVFTDGEGHNLAVANDGGQITFPRMFTYDQLVNDPAHDAGSIPRYEATNDYTYVEGDASRDYNPAKVNSFTREMVFIKDGAAANLYSTYPNPPDNWSNYDVWPIFIFDRVNATSPNYRKSFVMHFEDQPVISSHEASPTPSALIASIVPGHIEAFSGTTDNRTWRQKTFVRLYTEYTNHPEVGMSLQTILPANDAWNLTRIGGAGYEFWVDGQDYPNTSKMGQDEHAGKWRIEISPTIPSNFDNFLNVIYIYNSSTNLTRFPAMYYEDLKTADGSAKGVCTRDNCALFSTYGGALDGFGIESFMHTGVTRFFFADLHPSTAYHVRVESCGLPEDYTLASSDQGTIYLTTKLCGHTLVSASVNALPAYNEPQQTSYELVNGGKIVRNSGEFWSMTFADQRISTRPYKTVWHSYFAGSNYSFRFATDRASPTRLTVQYDGRSYCHDGAWLSAMATMNFSLDGITRSASVPNQSEISDNTPQTAVLDFGTIPAGQHTLNLKFDPKGCTGDPDHIFFFNLEGLALNGTFNFIPSASVNFSQPIKTESLKLGFNANAQNFWESPIKEQHYRDVRTNYVLIWAYGWNRGEWPGPDPYIQSYGSKPEGSLYDIYPYDSVTHTYNYTNLDRTIKHVLLNLSATPMVNLGGEHNYQLGCPDEMETLANTSACGVTYRKVINNAQCANFIAGIVQRYYTMCTDGTWGFCGNFSDWLWNFGNEPEGHESCGATGNQRQWIPYDDFTNPSDDSLIGFYKTTYDTVKARVPAATVGGWETQYIGIDDSSSQLSSYLNRTNLQFVSNHYPSNNTFYTSYVLPNWIAQKAVESNRTVKSIGIMDSQYNFDHRDNSVPPLMYEPEFNPQKGDYGGMWEGSTLIWKSLSNSTAEEHFESESFGEGPSVDPRYVQDTSNFKNPVLYADHTYVTMFGYGMWTSLAFYNYSTTPMFDVRKLFTIQNPIGATIVNTTSGDDLLEVFAVSTPHRAITVVNKRNITVTANINLGVSVGNIAKLRPSGFDTIAHSGSTFSPTLLPYEVGFYRLDGTCPESWICSAWEDQCSSGGYITRTCVDENGCGTINDRPPLRQACYGTCEEDWQCGAWGACSGGQQSRACTDSNACGTTYNRPPLTQPCSCTENWTCGPYGACVSGQHMRTCTDQNACGTINNRPNVTEACCAQSWYCPGWDACIGGIENRTCIDIAHCDITNDTRAESQSCSCSPMWSCTDWGVCSGGIQSRSCIDLTGCAGIHQENQTCSMFCAENWSCGAWGACSGGQQSRSCTDLNGCGTVFDRPNTTQPCGCTENWSCGAWGACSGGVQGRSCTDLNSCGTIINRPPITQSCSCTENWSCGAWGACVDYSQNRTCADLNACGTINNRPNLAQPCSCLEQWQCSASGACIGGLQNFTCNDLNGCNSTHLVVNQTFGCTVNCTSNWTCGAWGSCIGGMHNQTCTDINMCGGPANSTMIDTQPCTCTESWACGSWSICQDGSQSRACIDDNRCSANYTRTEARACSASCTELWSCSGWTVCLNNAQERTCMDLNACGTNAERPPESQSCSPAEGQNQTQGNQMPTGGMGSLPVINRPSGGGRGTSVCQPVWMCTNWTVCSLDYSQSRTCSDVNNCGTNQNRPVSARDCMYEPQCNDGVQDGDETGIDCGGDYCTQCVGQVNASGTGAAGGKAAGSKSPAETQGGIFKTPSPETPQQPFEVPVWGYMLIVLAALAIGGIVMLRRNRQGEEGGARPPI